MNIFSVFAERVIAATKTLSFPAVDWDCTDFSRLVIEPPRDPSHGDLACNIAMVLSKPLGLRPRDLAAKIGAVLALDDDVDKVDIAGPGFINLRLTTNFWTSHLRVILQAGLGYGGGFVPVACKVNVEYVSANPTGPMHVGHCRGAVVGDVLANLLRFSGHEVTKEYYINDAGGQIKLLAQSVYLRYLEALGEPIGEIPQGLYPGDYLISVGEALAQEYGGELKAKEDCARFSIVSKVAIAAMMDLIRDDLASLNVHHDIFFSEAVLHKPQTGGRASRIDETLQELTKRGLVYQGTLPPPKGQVPEDWEDRPQTLLRATDFGDDLDRPLKKADGTYTYFAADVAYFRDKYERGYRRMLYILGADHTGYVKRLGAVAKAISGDSAQLDVTLCQLVRLLRDGEPVAMSKRSGNLISLRDVVDEVGVDAVRFMMLYRKNDAPLDFDFMKVTEQTKDNPVFYVQYAHARICSVFKMAEIRAGLDENNWSDVHNELEKLTDPTEIGLVKQMSMFPRIIKTSVEVSEPHRLAFYLYELANVFHSHWNAGKEDAALRFIVADDRELTRARLALIGAVRNILATGLSIMGVSAPTEMR